jgi:AcrR family transcriptional regulator
MAERQTGAGTVTVADVVARAGISSTAFAALFSDREACLLEAFELGVQRAGATVIPAFEAEVSWLDSVKGALAGFLRFLDAEPELGRLLVFHSLGGGPEVQRRRREVLTALAAAVDQGAEQVTSSWRRPAPVMAEGAVGAVIAIIQNRLLADRQDALAGLFGELVHIVVLPYLGSSIARREVGRPMPRVREALGATDVRDPSAWGGPIKLTYRTGRVLQAIADYPGASNREVAQRAGIVDQGQISKLLSRLEMRGLIANIGGERTRGAPNSWQLSEQGELALSSEPASRSGR